MVLLHCHSLLPEGPDDREALECGGDVGVQGASCYVEEEGGEGGEGRKIWGREISGRGRRLRRWEGRWDGEGRETGGGW